MFRRAVADRMLSDCQEVVTVFEGFLQTFVSLLDDAQIGFETSATCLVSIGKLGQSGRGMSDVLDTLRVQNGKHVLSCIVKLRTPALSRSPSPRYESFLTFPQPATNSRLLQKFMAIGWRAGYENTDQAICNAAGDSI